MPTKRSPIDVERIVQLRLNGVPVRRVAEEVGCATKTVQHHWDRYLDARHTERREQVEREHQLVLLHLERAAQASWAAYEEALSATRWDDKGNEVPDPDRAAAARFMAEYRQAMTQYARLAGLSVERIEVSGPDKGPVEIADPRALLLARLRSMNTHPQGAEGDDSDNAED